MPASEALPGDGAARRVRALLTGLLASNLGDGATLFAIPWLVSSYSNDVLTLALLMLAGRVPYLFLSIPVGGLADRREPAGLMLASSTLRIAVLGTLVACAPHGGTGIVVFAAAAFFIGLSDMTFDTAAEVAVVRLAQGERLARANGHVRTIELVTSDLIGRPLGALLLKMGQAVPFLVNLVLSCLSLLAVLPLRGTAPPAVPGKAGARPLLAKGFAVLLQHPTLRLFALLSGILTFFYNMMLGVQVLFARKVLHTDSVGFALLLALSAVASVVGSQLAGRHRAGDANLTVRLRGALGAMAVAFLLQSAARSVWTALPGYALGGAAVAYWAVTSTTARQRASQPAELGRVGGVFRVITWGATPLGVIAGGLYASTTTGWIGHDAALWSVYLIAGLTNAVMLAASWSPIARIADKTIEQKEQMCGEP
ncbi:MFS transporter [Streptomyces chattanoogensis]